MLAHRTDFKALRKHFGDSIKGTAEFSYVSIGLGMALGFLLGAIQIPLPGIGKIAVGLSGVLIVALILGNLRRTGGMNWTIPLSANLVLRNLGLTLFLAQVGMASGPKFAATVTETGFLMLGLGALVLVALVLPILVLGLFVFKMQYDEVAGIVSGACGNPAILAYSNKLAPTDRPDIAYAMIFPGMTIVKIVFVDIVPALLCPPPNPHPSSDGVCGDRPGCGRLPADARADGLRAVRKLRSPITHAPCARKPRCAAPVRETARASRRHFGELAAVPQVAFGELAAHGIDDAGKRLALARQLAVNRAPIDAEMLGHAVDRAAAGTQQHHDDLADLHGIAPLRLHRGLGVEHAPREPGKLGIGLGIGAGEIRARAHDAVEVVAELDLPAEHALVHGTIGRRVVREAYPARTPLRPEELIATSETPRRWRAPSPAGPRLHARSTRSSLSTTTSATSSMLSSSASFSRRP